MKRKYATTKTSSKIFNNGPTVQTCFPKVIQKQGKLKAGLVLDWNVLKPGMIIRVTKLTVAGSVEEKNLPFEVVTLDQ